MMKKGKLYTKINKQLSIIVVPHSSQKIKSVLLPKPALIIYSTAALTILVFISAVLIQNIRLKSAVRDFDADRSFKDSYIIEREKEIDQLKSDREMQQKSIDDIQKKLKDMTDLETRIRSMLEPSRGRTDTASRSASQVKDMEGQIIGKNLLDTIKKMGFNGDKKIAMLNDTVATLLGGKATYPDRVFDSYIGFILGTGTNTCYIEENKNVKKNTEISARYGSMLVNVESGGYGRAPRGDIDLLFDKTTVNPGEYTFEKMISGGYQGGLILAVIKKAAADGLFSNEFSENIKKVMEFSSREINDFLDFPYSDNNVLGRCCSKVCNNDNLQDSLILYYLIDAMMERAAKLVAINISSIMIKTGKGKNPCSPVCITAEGTTFYKSKLFRGKLEYYIRKFLNDKSGFYCEFVKADNCTLIGTAIAGLMS
jgi:hexokinase